MSEESKQREEAQAEAKMRRSPGARLKAAREARGQSLDDAAKSLLIARGLLVALEADDYQSLGASVYVRGYLRKYGAFLDLPGDELVAAYESAAAPRDPRVRARAVNTLPRRANTHWLAPVIGALVIIVVILIALWVWRSGLIRKTAANPPAAAVSAAMAMTNRLPAVATADRAAVPPVVRARPTATRVAEGAGAAHLELDISLPSWVEVYDSSGKRLYYDLASGGQTLSFESSSLPFKVFLGNAARVAIKLDGKPVSIPAGDRSGTSARFEVPASGSTSAPGAATGRAGERAGATRSGTAVAPGAAT